MDDGNELDQSTPSVGSSPGKALVIMLLGLGLVIYFVYSLFSEDDAPKGDAPIKTERTRIADSRPVPAPIAVVDMPKAPPPPPAPKIQEAPPPPPPPIVASTPSASATELNKTQQQRRASSLLVSGGGIRMGGQSQKQVKGFPGNDPNMVFSREYLQDTGADQAEATVMGNLNYMVAQGKVIDAILETAINTDLPGPLRAIVSHDIYAESGREIMIPKGSRLIGAYHSNIKRGQTRVYVIWARLIRPDGIDIKIDSPGIDALGRAGVEGYTDNKYAEMLAASLLTSSISIAIGVGADALLDDSGTSSTSTSDGTTTSSGSAGSQAILQGIQQFSSTTSNIVKSIIEQQPTITVDQGTRIKVFVNRDLIMPPAILEQKRFIQ